MKTYELQTYFKGVWKIDSMFDDPEIAIDEAKRVEESRRYSGIRVIEEAYDEEKNRTSSRTVFRGGLTGQPTKDRKVVTSKQAVSAPRFGTGKEPVHRAGAPARQKPASLVGRIVILAVCIVVGLSALFGLQYLARLG